MALFCNGEVPRDRLILVASGTDENGYWEHLLPPATYRKHLALVRLGEQRRGRTLRITPGWNGYRPLGPQRTAREQACARGRCIDAAVPGSSGHGGTSGNADCMAIDYENWAWVWGTRDAFYAACREVGLEPGVIDWEFWHVVDRDPWAPVPAGEVEVQMTYEDLKAILPRLFKYDVRENENTGGTIWEKFADVVSRLRKVDTADESEGGGWHPFKYAMSRWLVYHSRADGPDGKGRTIHEALDAIEREVREKGTVTVRIEGAALAAALADPIVTDMIAEKTADVLEGRQRRRLEVALN